MKRIIGGACTVAIGLVATVGVLTAQQPLGVGTALGVQGAGVTEARRLDAALWNPALVGIYDGPDRSHSLLTIDVSRLPGRGWWEASTALGTATGSVEHANRTEWLRSVLGGSESAGGAAVNVGWLGVQSRDVALSITSHFSHSSAVPDRLFGLLTDREADADAAFSADWAEAVRSASSVASLAKGVYLGEFPVVGQLWTGVTGKVWWVHQYAEGRFFGDLPMPTVYDEIALRNVLGAGADVGIAGRAAGQLRYGASLSNVYSHIWTPKRGPRVRSVDAREVESNGRRQLEVVERFGPHQTWEDPDREAAERANALWENTRYPSVLRMGAAWDTPYGAAAVSWREVVEEGGLTADWIETPFAAAWVGPQGFPVRLSYGWGAEQTTIGAGVEFGPCDRRWGVSAGRHEHPIEGKWYTFAAAVTFSPWSCRMGPVR